MARDEAYKQAEQKIAEALQSGATELDLNGMDLTELPVSLGQLMQLQSLDISNNQQIVLPESLRQLTQLQSLSLSGNQLTTLPDVMGQLTQLQSLDINNNQLIALPESLGQLTQLQSLYLSYNKLTTLPVSLGQLTQLTRLELSNNQLTTLPPSLGQLTQLTSLHLSNNQLTTLPDSLAQAQLTQLTSLYLSNNKLTALSPSLGQLTQLTELNLSSNQLTALPDSLGLLTQLTKLNLSNNQLTNLPDSLGQLTQLTELNLSDNQLTTLPDSLGQLTQLTELNLSDNQLTTLPDSLGKLTRLQTLNLSSNQLITLPKFLMRFRQLKRFEIQDIKLVTLPEWLGTFTQLEQLNLAQNKLTTLPIIFSNLSELTILDVDGNQLTDLPDSLSELKKLKWLFLGGGGNGNPLGKLPECIKYLTNLEVLWLNKCQIDSLPDWLANLNKLRDLDLADNPLNSALQSAYDQGLDAVKLYLRAGVVIPSYEAKLILVGEGEVGKTCLMDALLDKPWQEHPSTHGIEIQTFTVSYFEQEKVDEVDKTDETEKNVESNVEEKKEQLEITLNGWDFGGQRVYRPTHQLFFSAPAVYLVTWKPREGPQQGFVKEWIQLVKRREPSAKIIVVATHGGPQQRQPDIDRQELWDLFGKDTVVDFFWVDSKPDENGKRKGIEELKEAIARVAAELPEVGRSVPKSFADVRAALAEKGVPYLPLDEVLAICRAHNMDDEIARLFITISHRLGHLTHYENDPTLRDIVILRPDWLASAMSYVLDDEATRNNQGLVKLSHLSILWNDPTRPAETRYTEDLHRIFLRLMERFDLSYRVAGLSKDDDSDTVSLIAQLVPDTTPQQDRLDKAWTPELGPGDIQQTQICRIVDAGNGQSANAEGLFYQLIVRLHRYSLGRTHWDDSVHWQRGLVLDANYNGRAILRHIGNDVHITVRAAFPERFLGMLTEEVKYLVDSFWEGLRCDVTVPCIITTECKGLFEVSKLIENKKRGRPDVPCPNCNEWQSIEKLLSNAPAATEAISLDTLIKQFAQVKDKLDEVNDNTKRILSQVDKQYADLIQLFTDEAKEGPRLFSLFPLDGNKFNPKTWVRHQFRLVLWCENARLPLPALNNGDMKKGVYDLEFDREWFQTAAPYLKFLTGTLSLVLPMASSSLKVIDDSAFKSLENQLNLGKNVIDAIAGEGSAFNEIMGKADTTNLEQGVAIRAQNSTLRELHALLKAKDPGFGGLVRVMNKRQEFLWVHEKYASEY